MTKEALLIFAKNAEAGKVKTRLAATIGNEAALAVYHRLLFYTAAVTEHLPCNKFVFYSHRQEQQDVWNEQYCKEVQQGDDLGERMQHAFASIFRKGYQKAVIIGTDCPGISPPIITNAFDQLQSHDITIGPAEDGGYYLLGMKQPHPQLFENMRWSTGSVLTDTKARCAASGLHYCLLPVLKDIDDEKDLLASKLQWL